jgi:hypothetical protein
MDRNRLVKLVSFIQEGLYKSEEERSSLVALFERNVPDPEASNLIFYHRPELTPEEIVDKALSYKPIITPPPSPKSNS